METLSPESSQTLQQLSQHQQNLPIGGGVNLEPVLEPAKVEPIPEPAQEPQVHSENVVEVDGQQFASEAEARKYLEQKYSKLEQEKLLDEARLEGMQSAMGYIPQATPQQVRQAEDDEPIDMDKYYEDPQGYLLERERKIEERLMKKMSAAQQAQQKDAEVWAQFTSKYPDLSDFKGDVDAVVNANMDMVTTLAKRDVNKAMDFVAMKTREKFQRWVDAQKPTKVLSNTKTMVHGGGNPPVTQPQNSQSQPKNLDFASQLRNLRKKPS